MSYYVHGDWLSFQFVDVHAHVLFDTPKQTPRECDKIHWVVTQQCDEVEYQAIIEICDTCGLKKINVFVSKCDDK